MSLYGKIKRKLYKISHPPLGEILMLHRVVNERSTLTANRKLEITPCFLEKTIQGFLASGRPIVSLDEAVDILLQKKKINKPFVCFTFDDGYKDNIEIAYHVFKKFKCPFVIYLTTGFPDQTAILWWYALEDLLKENSELLLGNGKRLKTETFVEKDAAFNYVRELIFCSPVDQVEIFIRHLLVNYPDSYLTKTAELALSWEQVRKLADDPLCTIGSHTLTHPSLNNLPDNQLILELVQSKSFIEKEINKPVIHFAYPFGIYNTEVKEAVSQAGYKTAMTIKGGKVRKGKMSVFEIKRISLEQ